MVYSDYFHRHGVLLGMARFSVIIRGDPRNNHPLFTDPAKPRGVYLYWRLKSTIHFQILRKQGGFIARISGYPGLYPPPFRLPPLLSPVCPAGPKIWEDIDVTRLPPITRGGKGPDIRWSPLISAYFSDICSKKCGIRAQNVIGVTTRGIQTRLCKSCDGSKLFKSSFESITSLFCSFRTIYAPRSMESAEIHSPRLQNSQ